MNRPILFSNQNLFLSYKFIASYGIPEQTISDWRQRGIGTRIYEGKEAYIDYKSIPARSKEKLPTESALRAFYKAQRVESLVDQLTKKLESALAANYSKWFNSFKGKYTQLATEKAREAAIRAALIECVLQLESSKGTKKAAYEAYNKVSSKPYESENAFYNALTKARQNGIESQAIDKRALREQKSERYDACIYALLLQLAASPIKLTNPEIHAALVSCCQDNGIENVPSVEWVKKHRKKALSNYEIFKSRYGSQAAFNELEPYAKINHAKHANSMWQIDGFTLPFYFGKSGEWRKLVLFAVLDNHSKKIVGYSFGESENTLVILAGLKDAVSATGYLPAEVVCDNHSFNQTDEASDLTAKLHSYGIHWTKSHNPRYKAILERTFKHFNEHFLKGYPGWTGQGILTKDKEGRPSQEYIDQYQKAGHRLTEDQIKINVIEAIDRYNNTVLAKYGKTPAQMYEESTKPHAIAVDFFEQARIFIPCKKAKVHRGQINIKRGGVLYEFQLCAELMHQYNNQEVLVRYEDLSQEIYLSDLKNDAYIGTVKIKRGINGAKVDQTAEDIEQLLKNKGRLKGFTTKATKENEAKAHPDAFADLNRILAPKELAKQLENGYVRYRAGEMGIDVATITTGRPVEDFTPASLKPKSKLENKTPFKVGGKHTIAIDNEEELID